ncbi:MAG: succinate--CoA ligase subunit alpha [Armatimonadota bacterium]
MSILIDQNTRVLIQGLTGREGQFHSQQMIEYGTKVVAGVTPGKGGTESLGVPVYDTVIDAVSETGANAACIFVPARFAMDAILEGVDAGLDLIVAITDGIPTQDMIRAVDAVRGSRRTRLIGPNCPGLTSAGKCKIGIMPGNIFKPGNVGVISRSGTLTYEIVDELTRAGLGQTTCIGIGGDPILGMRFVDALPLFESDPETKAVVMVGEIGGSDEEIAADYIKRMKKPVIGFISGRSAPPGKRMGHAGAIISGKSGTPEAKIEALTAAKVAIADTTQEIPALVKKALKGR